MTCLVLMLFCIWHFDNTLWMCYWHLFKPIDCRKIIKWRKRLSYKLQVSVRTLWSPELCENHSSHCMELEKTNLVKGEEARVDLKWEAKKQLPSLTVTAWKCSSCKKMPKAYFSQSLSVSLRRKLFSKFSPKHTLLLSYTVLTSYELHSYTTNLLEKMCL